MSKVPYALSISSLMYVMVCTRLNNAHAMGVVSRYMSNPGKHHQEVVKWIMRYLKGTSDTCLCFIESDLKLEVFVDVDLAGDIDTKKNHYRFCVLWVIQQYHEIQTCRKLQHFQLQKLNTLI